MSEDTVQYCYNLKTKEIVEGTIPPSEDFVPIIGYFKRNTDPIELRMVIESIVNR